MDGNRDDEGPLRDEAKARLSGNTPVTARTPEALLHELQVHQIELEMQNEALRESQAALEASRDQYADLYEFAPVGYLTLSRTGQIEQANLTAAKLFGMERRGAVHRRFSLFVASEDRERWEVAFIRALRSAGETQSIELALGGDTSPRLQVRIDCAGTPGTDPASVRVVITDIHLLKQTQQRLELANSELANFGRSISHDLQGPIRSIDGFSHILLEDHGEQLDAPARMLLTRILASTHRMGQLIEGLRSLSGITRSRLSREMVDLSSLARAIAGDLAAGEPLRRVEFAIQDGICAHADAGMMTVLLHNLLGNAWKFTSMQATARIEFASGGETAGFRVGDNGVGFATADARHLFEPFCRLHTEREFPGVGIGLATVKCIVLRHEGRIWAEAEPGRGATFHFTLAAG
jgi:PAS domain S-box-containing protein